MLLNLIFNSPLANPDQPGGKLPHFRVWAGLGVARVGVETPSPFSLSCDSSQHGLTALRYAAMEGHLAVAEALLARGADKDAIIKVRSRPEEASNPTCTLAA
jgi:hypothetical protein